MFSTNLVIRFIFRTVKSLLLYFTEDVANVHKKKNKYNNLEAINQFDPFDEYSYSVAESRALTSFVS